MTIKESLLAILRDRSTPTAKFRAAARELSSLLVDDLAALLHAGGCDPRKTVFVIVLRSAIALLDAAIEKFPSAQVAVAGLKRDEETAIAHWYYQNFPLITADQTIVIIDPMLATGGSAEETVLNLKKRGADPKHIYFLGVIAAPEGIARLCQHIPASHIVVGATDQGLDGKKYIVPGLGDFGDRYFGYSDAQVMVPPHVT